MDLFVRWYSNDSDIPHYNQNQQLLAEEMNNSYHHHHHLITPPSSPSLTLPPLSPSDPFPVPMLCAFHPHYMTMTKKTFSSPELIQWMYTKFQKMEKEIDSLKETVTELKERVTELEKQERIGCILDHVANDIDIDLNIEDNLPLGNGGGCVVAITNNLAAEEYDFLL